VSVCTIIFADDVVKLIAELLKSCIKQNTVLTFLTIMAKIGEMVKKWLHAIFLIQDGGCRYL